MASNLKPLNPIEQSPFEGCPQPEISPWLALHQDYIGARLVSHLYANPDRHFYVMDLSGYLDGGGILLPVDHGLYVRFREEKIPMTDAQTIAACHRELKTLIPLIASALDLGSYALAERLFGAFDKIRRYLMETTTPRGRIRFFPNAEQREYQRLLQAFRRILDLARREYPEAYYYIKQHVKTGATFAWLKELRASLRKKGGNMS